MKPAESHFRADEISPARLRAELEIVLRSEPFQRSPQLQRFLRYLVDETLSGRSERIKEYVIGTEVFGRPADYDPQLDSLVRVEAHRLRSLLDQYYQAKGAHDHMRIGLNKGSYVPYFRNNHQHEQSEPAPQNRRRSTVRITAITAAILLAIVLFWLYFYKKAFHEVLPSGATIAILPFDNFSSEAGMEYFCFGLEDEITTELAKTGKLRVVARTSASRFKRGDDILSIGKQLKADAVLEGSVQRSADRLRISAQLVSTANNLHIWSETYEKPSADLFAAQDQVAQAVTRAIQDHVRGTTHGPRLVDYSSDPQANEFYWKGAYYRSPLGKAGWRRDLAVSAEYFERAVEKDPKFAQAYAAMADVYVHLAWERGGGPVTTDYMTRGRRAALRALELQSNLAEAYGALGTVQFFYDYDAAAAEKSFQRALQLDPSSAKARMWYGMALCMQGRATEALAQATQAKQLDPLSYVSTTHLAVIHYFSRDNDEAIRLAREILAFADIPPAHGLLGMAYEVQHNYDAAIAEYHAGLRLVPNHAYIRGMMGHAYALSGHREEALKLLKDYKKPFEEGGLSDLKVSYIYIGLGDYDEALRHLQLDLTQHDPELPYINRDPVFDPVREDPRFVAILRAMGLANKPVAP